MLKACARFWLFSTAAAHKWKLREQSTPGDPFSHRILRKFSLRPPKRGQNTNPFWWSHITIRPFTLSPLLLFVGRTLSKSHFLRQNVVKKKEGTCAHFGKSVGLFRKNCPFFHACLFKRSPIWKVFIFSEKILGKIPPLLACFYKWTFGVKRVEIWEDFWERE